MPNYLGIDLHNFKDEYLNIEETRDSLTIKGYIVCYKDIKHNYYIESSYSKRINIIHNLLELKDDKFISYVFYNSHLNDGKPRRIIVPLDIIPDSDEFTVAVSDVEKLLWVMSTSYRDITFNIKDLNEDFDISDTHKCLKMLYKKEHIKYYMNLLFGKI